MSHDRFLRDDAAQSLTAAGRMLAAARGEIERAAVQLAAAGERGDVVTSLVEAFAVVHRHVVLCVQAAVVSSPRSSDEERATAQLKASMFEFALYAIEQGEPWEPWPVEDEDERDHG